MGNIAVTVHHVSKQYRIGGAKKKYNTFRETITDTARASLKRLRATFSSEPQLHEDDTIWALRDVTFDVKKGQAVGIIGRNGAGKSTLLKVLSRITKPTTGRALLYGRVGSLLEVGTGFHPELTGRENIFLSGAIIGMHKVEIERKFDDIVAFAGVEKFLDTPVKHFSSGMYTRLAFAVAANLEPEILVVDEVLAVGDIAFQEKCVGKMSEVASGGRTVLFVSHNMSAVASLCSTAILLDKGAIVYEGSSSDTIAEYVARMRSPEQALLENRRDRQGTGVLRVSRIFTENLDGTPCETVAAGQDVRFVLEYQGAQPAHNVLVNILIAEGTKTIFSFSNEISDRPLSLPASGRIVCTVPNFPLVPGNYDLHFKVFVDNLAADKIWFARHLVVSSGDFYGTGILPTNNDYYGRVMVAHKWSIEPDHV